MWDSFISLLKRDKQPELGALLDERPKSRIILEDVPFDEIVAKSNDVDWREIPKDEVRQFGVQNQYFQSSCVAHTRRKLRRILWKVNKGWDVDFSEGYIYRKRANYPSEGMAAYDAIKIDKEGVPLRDLLPTEGFTEAKMNQLKIEPYHEAVGKVFSINDDVVFSTGDLFTPSATIQLTKKGVMMWFYFTFSEWAREVPQVIESGLRAIDRRAIRHSVVGVEPALYHGMKGVWIEDSAHFGGFNRRFITQDFYENRNFWASYPINFVFEPQTEILKKLTKTAKLGDNNNDVKNIQDFLKKHGTFPRNVESTGYYGALTARAVKEWQKANWQKFYAIDRRWTQSTLESLNGASFGSISLRVANDMV